MNISEKDAWAHFTATGSVADYLKYTAAKHEQEQKDENQNGRDRDPRAEHQGIGQDRHYTDKK